MGVQVLLLVASLVFAILTDVELARVARELLDSGGAADEIERAAFIVRKPTGSVELLRWPNSGFYAATWRGPLPEGTVAVIHTHPRHRPIPSAQDRAEAKRLSLPFYVVSRGALCVANPAHGVYCAARIPWLMRGGLAPETGLEWMKRMAGGS